MTEPLTVTMRALRYHTYNDQAYDEGQTYEARAEDVETLEALQLATRLERAPR
jgi:hypothetical protein